MIPVIYGELCPQCGGDLSWFEIERNICKKKNKDLSYDDLIWKYRDFENFFREKIGTRPRAIQRMWARRVLNGMSFAAIAPTGIGKTLFGVVMASYLAEKGKKSYILLPTTLLLKEVVDRLEKLGYGNVVAYYYGRSKEKEAMKRRIEKGDFQILVTTTAFLSRNYSLISRFSFKFIFVDDVDALLKRSKNVDKIVSLVLRGKGVLMVSTATGSRGYNTSILREKLNFDVGNVRNAVRNVEDIYGKKENIEKILKMMGPGALIFTPTAEEARTLLTKLQSFNVGLVLSEDKNAYESFRSGKLDYLLGVATPYGSLIRGLDMPERVRYVIFYGMPRFRIGVKDINSLSERLTITLAYLLRKESKILEKGIEKGDMKVIREEIIKILSEGKRLEGEGFLYEDGFIIFPDVRTYIQGSGRASRLYAGGITKGASFLLDDEDRIKIFVERANVYGIDFSSIEEVDMEALKREIDEDRRKLRDRVGEREIIKPSLFIVESPNKAKHIAKFFGKPNIRIMGNAVIYEVAIGDRVLLIAPSLGHIVDLSTARGYHGVIVKDATFIPVYNPLRKCRDCGYQFTEGDECPICGSKNVYRAKEQIEVLRMLAYECEEVIIGTDPDTEGEKIAWDLRNLLLPYATSIKRAEFHEVTKSAIIGAIKESREIKENLVKAQIVRRVEDRWIGFELSHILWDKFNDRNLSAGRAQTPTLGWIIERYEKSKEKKEVWFLKGTDIKVPWKGEIEGEIRKIGESIKEYIVAPYTTDEILKDAYRILGIGSGECMRLLQTLFEMGLITYHRTDSTHVSEEGLKIAKRYLGGDFKPRRWGEEGAHECIRPTRPWSVEDLERYVQEGIISLEINRKLLSLYDLIFRRFMASQSIGYITIARYVIRVRDESIEAPLIISAHGRAYQLYPYRVSIYRPLKEGKGKIELEKRMISPPLYTQADIIRLMKELKIGRPSTYATIIEKLFRRRYVREYQGKLIPTERGINVYEFLIGNYRKFISEERTRVLEEKMDEVERGEREYNEVLSELYREMNELRGN